MSKIDIKKPIENLEPQHQDNQPGSQSNMKPEPRGSMESYKAAEKLKNKVALISGGDSGIGRAIAIGYAKEGADIAIIYLNEEEDAYKTKELIEKEGRKAYLIKGDIRNRNFCSDAIEQCVQTFGKLNILVNNAAQQYVNDNFSSLDLDQMEHTFQVNIFSIFYLTKAALNHMQSGDSIINTTSITAYRGHEELVDYASTKGAITAFTRSLATQLAEKNIRVNAVALGPIWTPLIPASFPKEKVASFGNSTAMKRPGQPDEVAPCYIFLASDDASYITGQVLHPNGGSIVNA